METPAAVTVGVQKRKQAGLAKKIRPYIWGIVFLLPATVIFCVFLWTPILKGMYYSFFHIDFVNGNEFVGLKNYQNVMTNSDFWLSVRNTLYYVALGLIIGYWVPSLVAIAISELKWFQGLARLAVYLPAIVPGVVLYGMWMWLLDPGGPLNHGLSLFGIGPVEWLTSKKMAMISIVLMETWQGFGTATLMYLAGIVSIPRDLYEAAEIDGAGIFRRIFHITLPGIRHIYLLLFISQIIHAAEGFQTHLAMTGGGPNNATFTYMLMVIRQAFVSLDYGKASAMGVLMFIVLTASSIVLYSIQTRRDRA
jgi:multiple sugar transport system permease protein